MTEDVRRKRRHIEDALQIAIVYALKLEFDEHDLVIVHPANGGLRKQVVGRNGMRYSPEAAKLRAMGVLAGATDLLFWWPERVEHGGQISKTGRLDSGFIELKIPAGHGTPPGTLNDNQEIFRDRIIGMGGKWAVCRNYEETKSTLLSWGVVSRAMKQIERHG